MPLLNTETDTKIGLAWALSPAWGKGARVLRRLLLYAGSPQRVLNLRPEEALEVAGEGAEEVLPLLSPALSGPEIDEQERRLRAVEGRLLFLGGAGYPRLLGEIHDPPPVLFARGRALEEGPAIAVVGARRASRGALEAARVLSEGLALAGVIVVSGFARGVDAAAHRAALEAGGMTVGVLGCGIDVCYPAEQSSLLSRIVESGTILSELPMGRAPAPFHFPLRNRLIAGLSRIVLVIEAAEKSGSLITARCATDYGRDVAAVPGSIVSKQAAGSNALLKDGAILVRSIEDLLGELPEDDLALLRGRGQTETPASGTKRNHRGLSAEAAALLALLDLDEPRDTDALSAEAKLGASRLSAALLELELEGLVVALSGGSFLKAREKS